jgi:hypothetical protein
MTVTVTPSVPMAPAVASAVAPTAVHFVEEFVGRVWRQRLSHRKRCCLDRMWQDAHANGEDSGARQSLLYQLTAIHRGHGSLPDRTGLAGNGQLPMRPCQLKHLMP